MAYNPNNLLSSAAGLGSGKRIFPTVVQPKTFAAGSGTLVVGQVVAFNTSTGFWVPWDADGSNGTAVIKGIIFPDPVVLDSDEQVLGQVMLMGRAHVDDLVPGGSETVSDMKADLRTDMRDLGIIIEGLDAVR